MRAITGTISVLTAAWLTMAMPASAAVDGLEVDWNRTPPASGRVVDDAVELVAGEEGAVFPLVTIHHPELGGGAYAVSGLVRYEEVAGAGYLEMWSVFSDGSRYFSRTLEQRGPLAILSGRSDWREFELPFFPGEGPLPTALEINVVLPGAGRVWIGPLAVADIDGSSWWSGPTAGLVGGIGGAVIGILGGLCGWLVGRARARRFVLGTALTLTVIGGGLIVGGVVALFARQPYEVAFPLLLGGGILVTVFWGLIGRARQTYSSAELRRMRALDAP